jgi:hypothetical protein
LTAESDDNKRSLGPAACEVILQLLRSHADSQGVVLSGIGALWHLSMNGER